MYICKRFHRLAHTPTDYIFPWNFIDSNLELVPFRFSRDSIRDPIIVKEFLYVEKG